MANVSDNLATYRSQYQRDGVIRLRHLYSTEQVDQIRDELARYVRDVVPTLPANEIVYEVDGESIRNLWRMERHDRFFGELASDPELLGLLTKLLGGEPVLMGVETFNKPARVGSNVPAHQDNAYFCKTPSDVLTVWIAIDPATAENGPVTYYRGTHTLGTLPHRPSGVAGNSMGLAEPFTRGERFVGTLEPGDALIHHCQTIHESEPNQSARSRSGLLMVFRGAHTRKDPTLKERYRLASALS